jgi:hypothetical protein
MHRLEEEEFADVARDVSEDTATAPKGGDMGTIRQGVTVAQFEDAVFGEGAENIGKLIGPVETAFGYHLIVVESFTPASTKTLEDARADLDRQVRERKARRAAVDKIEDLSERAQRDPTVELRAIADSLGAECLTSELFSAVSPPEWLNDPMEAQKAAASPLKVVSAPVDIPETPDSPEMLVIYMPTERIESYVPTLEDEEARASAREGWIRESATTLASKQAEEYIVAARRLGFSMALDSLPPESVDSGTTDFFPRLRLLGMVQPPVNAADIGQLYSAVFQLAATGDVADRPITVNLPDNPGFLAVGLADFRKADPAPLADSLGALRQQAVEMAAQGAFSIWAGNQVMRVNLRLPPEVQQDAANQRQLD